MENNSEKRKFKRVTTHIPVKYRKLGDTDTIMRSSTVSRNLSEGGVRFFTSEFMSRACRLVLELDVPMLTKPVKAISKVAWIKKSSMGEDFEIGNQFLEISRKDKEIVSEYLKGLTLYNEPENPIVSN